MTQALPNLTRKLDLQTRERVTDNAGGFSDTWVTLGTLWAEVTARTGRLGSDDAAPVSTVGYRIVVRAAAPGDPARPRPGQRLTEGARRFAITAVADWGSGGRFLVVFAEEEVTA